MHFGLTTFFAYLATNRSLDHAVIPKEGLAGPLSQNQTLREVYVELPYELEKSVLANPLSANVVVISKNQGQDPSQQVIIRRRSKKVALYPGRYQVSAAGYVSLSHKGEDGQPNPFVTAVEEARQEIADSLKLAPSDFKMIGLAVNWEDFDLNAYGYVETGFPVSQLLGGFRRDDYEGWTEAIPFTPQAVLSHIVEND